MCILVIGHQYACYVDGLNCLCFNLIALGLRTCKQHLDDSFVHESVDRTFVYYTFVWELSGYKGINQFDPRLSHFEVLALNAKAQKVKD